MFPLSAQQQVVWLHEQVQPDGIAYHFTAQLDLTGPLDETALTIALAAVIDRHPMFRTALVPGTDQQVTAATVATPIRFAESPELSGPRWQAILREHGTTLFDLTRPPLVRWTLVRCGPDRRRLLHTEHHLVHDGQSWAIVLRDLFTAYQAALRGEPISLPEAPLYEEFVAWQRRPQALAARDRAVARWTERLTDAPSGSAAPRARRPAGRKRFAGAQHRQRLAPALADRVRLVASRHRHTTFSVLFALFAELARRHNEQPELVIGTAVGNRPPAFAGTVGMFVNALPIRLPGDPGQPAADYVGSVMKALFGALEDAAAPIQDITRAAGMSAAGLDNPLFQLMFSSQDASMPELDLGGLRAEVTGALTFGTSRLDIDVVVVPDDRLTIGVPRTGPAGMLLIWDYDTDRYDQQFIELMADRYARLLGSYAAAPESPLGELPMTDAAEPPAATIGIGPSAAYASDDLFGSFASVAAQRADAPALIAGPHVTSYRELVVRTEQLADRLSVAGVKAGGRVAVALPRSAGAVVTLLACLRLGATFCPLSPADPPGRRQLLLDRLRPDAVITEGDVITAGAAARPGGPQPDDGVAYILHTSGSTGLPKSVAVSRSSLAAHAAAAGRQYRLDGADRVLQFAQPSFDVFLEETLPTLLAGGALVIAAAELLTGADLVALLGMRAVTVANLPTSFVAAVLPDLKAALASWSQLAVRLLVLGGERISAELARQVRDVFGAAELVNAYGVTEATITSTCFRLASADVGEVPIGRPLAGTDIYVVDQALAPLPAGFVGEIAIGGAGVALGYLDDAGETARRFTSVAGVAGRCYLTGDLGFWRPDGQLCFLGRADNQVKLLGHRIELEEVESAAAEVLAGARRAVVLDKNRPVPRLIGFAETGDQLSTEVINRALGQRLPAHMLPERWIAAETMPLLAGGKPDRAALATMITAEPPAPRSSVFDRVRAIWCEVLGTENLSGDSDFFTVGGHSLLAIQIVTRVQESLGGGIPLALIFDEPQLGRFAEAVRRLTARES